MAPKDDEARVQFSYWMRRVANALTGTYELTHDGGVYEGTEGAKRLGRECGPALLDFGEYGIKNIGATYSGICVIGYNLKPPIDAGDWLNAVREGYEKAKRYDRRNANG